MNHEPFNTMAEFYSGNYLLIFKKSFIIDVQSFNLFIINQTPIL